MEEIKFINNRSYDIFIHIFQVYNYAPDPIFREFVQEKKTNEKKVKKCN